MEIRFFRSGIPWQSWHRCVAMARKFAFPALVAASSATLMSGCSHTPPPRSCLEAVEHAAGEQAIKAAPAPPIAGGAALCEGIRALTDNKPQQARVVLEKALSEAPQDQGWIVRGYLARALLLTNGDDATMLRYWDEAIKTAARAGTTDRENLFRLDRGTYYAQRKNWGPALVDLAQAHDRSDKPGLKMIAAYYALGASTNTDNLAAAEKWYANTVTAAKQFPDAERIAHASELYAQLLDKHTDFARSDRVYRDATAIMRASGSAFLQGEILEFHGQSRAEAGDYNGARRIYGEAAVRFRNAGRDDYADYLEGNLRAMLGRIESGARCFEALARGDTAAATRSVLGTPKDRRSIEASMCLVRAYHQAGDTASARSLLDSLAGETESNSIACAQLRGIARELDGAEPAAITTADLNSAPESSADNRCEV
jgi:tetratricopeptide (TPR) repeat protein